MLSLSNIQLGKRSIVLLIVAISFLSLFIADLSVRIYKNVISDNIQAESKSAELSLLENLEVSRRKELINEEWKDLRKFVSIKGSDKEVMTVFLREIETLSSLASCSIVSLTPKRKQAGENSFETYKAELKLDGDLRSVVHFFYALNSSSKLVYLDAFTLTPKDKKGNLLRVEADVCMKLPC